MLVVAIATFVLIHLAPGDPAAVILGPDARPEDVHRLQRQLGLDLPIPVQLARWLGRLVRADFGDSIFLHRPVIIAITERLEPTLILTTLATFVAVAIGSPRRVTTPPWIRRPQSSRCSDSPSRISCLACC
jgi:peptide/nickel transport system permease protein